MPAKITEQHEGCWFDCARGQYIGEAVIETAREYGWKYRSAGFKASDLKADSEFYGEAWDAAENHMNTLAPEGFYFGTSDWGGDWGLWKAEEE